jgi:hypothetical protein
MRETMSLYFSCGHPLNHTIELMNNSAALRRHPSQRSNTLGQKKNARVESLIHLPDEARFSAKREIEL